MPKLPKFIIAAIAISFIVIFLNLSGLELLSSSLELLIVPITTIIYYVKTSNKSKRLTVFFIIYSIGDIVNLLDFNYVSNWSYYVCNILYITSYGFLLSYIFKSLDFRLLLKNYLLDTIVLLLLDVYMVYVLIKIVKPVNFESKYIPAIQAVELLFSLVLILLMSFSFLNYIQNTKKKYFFLFLGCLSLAFSELILIGYYYITDEIMLSYTSTALYVSGFLILYYHSLIHNNEEEDTDLIGNNTFF